MRRYLNLSRIVLAISLLLVWTGQAIANKKVVLATAEREPYIGKSLPGHGYVHELVKEVFKRAGYEVVVEFYPLARAKRVAEYGKVDGLIPAYREKSSESPFVFSNPFPGDSVGLLKKKSLQVSYSVDPGKNLMESLRSLREYQFGVVRGTSIVSAFEQADFLKKQVIIRDIQNIDKLATGRIDFAVIDKYTAADLMVGQRPHLIGQLEYMNPPLASNAFHVAFSKKSKHYQQLLNDFNRCLSLLENDGTLKRILDRHGLFQPGTSDQGKKKLVIGALNNREIRSMKVLSQGFERDHPNLRLEWRILDENILRKRILADLAISDGQFDIMMIGSYEGLIWSENQWLVPIDDLPEEYDLEDVLEPVRDGFSYQNKLYALPILSESTMTFYRKDLFEKAGITMPRNPTYQEIMKFAKAIHDPENGIYGIGLRGKAGWGMNMAYVSILVNTFGGRWFDENWKPTIHSDEWRKALTYYEEILRKYGHPNRADNGWDENQKLFAKGHLGMIIDATSLAGRLYDAKIADVYGKIGFAATPIAQYAKGSQWLWSWGLAIPASSKLPKEAKKFITWATSKKYIKLVAESEGWLAVPPGTRLSTYGKEYNEAAPFASFVIQAIQNTNPMDFSVKPVPYAGIQFVAIPEFPAIGHQVGLKIAKILEGEISIEKALQDSQKIVDLQMRRSGYY